MTHVRRQESIDANCGWRDNSPPTRSKVVHVLGSVIFEILKERVNIRLPDEFLVITSHLYGFVFMFD